MTRPKIVLSTVSSASIGREWVRKVVQKSLCEKYHFEILCSPADVAFFADLDVPVHGVADIKTLPGVLRQIAPLMVQTFSVEDHRYSACFAKRSNVWLLATHLFAEDAPRDSWKNRWLYNSLTDVNLFANAEAKVHSGQSGYLGIKRPMVLTQPHLGDDSVLTVLDHAYSSLLTPNRQDFAGNVKRDYSDLKLAYVTHFYCNQQDISSVTRLLERYAAYPPEVLARVQFVIVDDGSPIEYKVPDLPLNLTWLKIDQDIRWNQAGARNLGAVYARADTLLLTDLDHELPLESMRQLIERSSCGKRLYKMWRRDEQGKLYKGHSNFFVMSRGRFFECHGYDEEFAGHYGAEDFRFVKYQKARGSFQTYLPKKIHCIERSDIDRKRSYHSLSRDLTFNTAADSRKRREMEQIGHGYGHSRMFLNFTWTTLVDRQLAVALPRARCRAWKWTSLLRQILPRW